MIDIKIMACKKRADNIFKILKKLNMDESIVVWDDRQNGGDAMYTAMKAWLAPLPENATHRLVLQDDVDICDNFIEHVESIINCYPNKVISLINFLHPTNYPNKRGTPYYEVFTIAGCAIIMPKEIIKPCMEWCQNYEDETYKPHDDLMISTYCNIHNIQMITILPCIVQHLNIPSLFNVKYSWERICRNYDSNPSVNWNIHSIQKIR